MKPAFGVLLELVLAFAVSAFAIGTTFSYPFSTLLLLLAQILLAFLLHCPAHYIVGRVFGIEFKDMRPSRISFLNNPPRILKPVSSALLVFSLVTNKDSLGRTSKTKVRAMYLSGVLVSTTSTFVFAGCVALRGMSLDTIITFIYAIVYLLSNVIMYQRGGDVRRALTFGKTRLPS